MRIDRVDIFPITLELHEPIPMANGVITSTGNVVVRLESDDGVVGWGEGVEAPALTHQTQGDIVSDLRALVPVIIGSDPMMRSALWSRLFASRPKATTAIGAIDIAVHDLAGKALGVPVHQLIGGAVRTRIPALTLVGSGDPLADAEKLAERHEAGFTWFKIKLGMSSAEVELATLAKAVELVGRHGMVCGDANEGWDEAEAISFLRQLDGGQIRFVEQPVPRTDPAAMLRLADSSSVKLCADESAGSLSAVIRFVGTAMGGVSLKLIKHGGVTGVMRGAGICAVGGLSVNLAGKVIESSISAAANLHCAAAMDAIDFGCSPANQGVVQDVTQEPVSVDRGRFDVPTGPGLGVNVDEKLLAKLAM